MDVHPVLKLAEAWQKSIVADLTCRYPEASLTALNQAGFNVIAVVLCLYFCERRQIIQPKSLQILQNYPSVYNGLIQLWQTLELRFGRRFAIFAPSPQFLLPDSLLQKVIKSLCQAAQSAELSVAILGQLYETISVAAVNLSQGRKSGGVYYTPKPIVQYMLQSTIDRADLLLPTVLDPACGGGAFLIEAYQCLLNRYLCHSSTEAKSVAKLSLAERRYVLDCIHGVDIDPQAVAITQLSLWLQLCEDIDEVELATLSQVEINVHCGNALLCLDSSEEPSITIASFDWRSAFPEILTAGGFDIVIGNPPYVDAETMTMHLPDWRSYCTSHYQTATGNWDLFCVFIEKALQLCREGGITSLIVPNKLFSAQYAGAARAVLLQNSCLLSIRDYSCVPVFNALVYPIVYIAQKRSSSTLQEQELLELPKTTATRYEQMRTVEQVECSHSVQLHSSTSRATQPWSIGVQIHTDLMQRLDQLPKLGEVAQVMGAATVAEAYSLQSLIQNNSSPAQGLRLVNSGTIDRYQLLWGQKPLRYLGQTYQYPIISISEFVHLPPKRLAQAQQTKIIVAGMSQRLEAALDYAGEFLAGKSTVLILTKDRKQTAQATHAREWTIDLRYLLGLLNSRLLSFYLLNRFSGNRLQGGYFRVGPPQMRELPILLPNLEQLKQYERMIELVDNICALKKLSDSNEFSHLYNTNEKAEKMESEFQTLDSEIDLITYELYQLSEIEINSMTAFNK